MPNFTTRRRIRWRSGSRERSRGQSMVEFALLVPVLLLLVLMALDFGRIYLGWVNLQNMARIGANFAASNPTAWGTPGDATVRQRYGQLIANDAKTINCDATGGIQDPQIVGTALGDPVNVTLQCRFAILTPIVGSIFPGGKVLLSASAASPIRTGTVPTIPGGGPGTPIVTPPTARFVASPTSGYAPLTVQFTDTSIGVPTSWSWVFEGAGNSLQRDPSVTWTAPGIYSVTLTVSNAGGSNQHTESSYVVVTAPPTTGPVPDFTATPRTGNDPLAVKFTGSATGTPTTWSWDFGDSTSPATTQSPSHTYQNPGTYDVTLTVSDGAVTNSLTRKAYVLVDTIPCRVPNFFNVRKQDATGLWTAAGFGAGNITLDTGSGNYLIKSQSLAGTSVPDTGCAATIRVGP